MERPNTILGMTTHLVRARWQSLSSRGRLLAIAGAAVLAVGGAGVARAALGAACCEGSCASMRAAHAATLEVAPVAVAPAAAAHDCPYSN